jgi:urease accessory protein
MRPGYAALAVKKEDGVTRLADLAQAAPLRLLFPRVPEDEPLTACLTNTSGGVVGGDRHCVRITAMPGAQVLAMGQAAEKIYRSNGETAVMEIELTAESDSWLEWMPQETILFDGSKLARRARIEIAETARTLTGEILVFGRKAHGESLNTGLIRDVIEVTRSGRMIWADALHMEGDLRTPLAHPTTFADASASGLLILHAPDAATYRDALRELEPPEGVRFGATAVAGLLIARWLAWDNLALRRHYGAAWTLLRAQAGGLPARLPPLWHI